MGSLTTTNLMMAVVMLEMMVLQMAMIGATGTEMVTMPRMTMTTATMASLVCRQRPGLSNLRWRRQWSHKWR